MSHKREICSAFKSYLRQGSIILIRCNLRKLSCHKIKFVHVKHFLNSFTDTELIVNYKRVSEYDQEVSQLNTADQPTAQ